MRKHDDIEGAIEAHADAVWRACRLYLPYHDAEDAFQETFVRLARHEGDFTSDEHRKAWLLRVAVNLCKDQLKSAHAKTDSVDQMVEAAGDSAPALEAGALGVSPYPDPEERATRSTPALDALAKLPQKYREVLSLVYCEGLDARSVAGILGIPENTVYTRLARGRTKLKEVYDHG